MSASGHGDDGLPARAAVDNTEAAGTTVQEPSAAASTQAPATENLGAGTRPTTQTQQDANQEDIASQHASVQPQADNSSQGPTTEKPKPRQKDETASTNPSKKSQSSSRGINDELNASPDSGETLSPEGDPGDQRGNSSDSMKLTSSSMSSSPPAVDNQQDTARFAYMIQRNDVVQNGKTIYEGTFTRNEINSLDLTDRGNAIVIFLPRITELLKQPDFIEELIKKFGIDRFYLTQTAYDSNGFFRGSTAEKSVASRFLVKELSKIDDVEQFERVRQDLYDLVPKPVKDELEKARSATDSEIVSSPDDSNATLVSAFLELFRPYMIRDAISERMFNEKQLRNEIERHQNFRKSHNPSSKFEWSVNNRRETREVAEHFAASRGLSPSGREKVRQSTVLASQYTKKFVKMLEDLAKSEDSGTACDVLTQWMAEKDEVRLVLPSVIELCMANGFKFLPFVDEILVNIYHQTNCILKDRPQQGPSTKKQNTAKKQAKPDPSGQATESKDITNTKPSSKSKSKPESEPNPKCRDIQRIYHWFFFFFWIRTFTRSSDQSETQVLLCFDDADSPKIKNIIRSILSREIDSWNSPEKLLYAITEQVVSIYDTALWGFRSPVRDIEKKRSVLESNIANSSGMYFGMHELLRHLIHSQETLAATEGVLDAALMETTSADAYVLRFCLTFVKNLRLRAGAFMQRLNNELSLAYHINNAKQLESVDGLLQQSQDDGRDVAKFVGYATLFFLPGTFISGFFSMTFFGFDSARNGWGHSRMVWVWFVVTIPVTAIGVFLFAWRHSEKTLAEFLKSGIDNVLFLKGDSESGDEE